MLGLAVLDNTLEYIMRGLTQTVPHMRDMSVVETLLLRGWSAQ